MQPRYTYSVREPLTKQKERIQKLKKQNFLNMNIEVNSTRHVFNKIRLIMHKKIQLEE